MYNVGNFENKNLRHVARGAPQENDPKFRFAIHQQGIRQFHDNCKIAKCHIGASLTVDHAPGSPSKYMTTIYNYFCIKMIFLDF